MTSGQLFQMEKLTREERERVFYAIVAVLGRPLSYVEVGCGDGWLVRAAKQLMARPAIGIGTAEDYAAGRKWAAILTRDYTRPFNDIFGRYALVLALSEGAHIESAAALVAPRGHLVADTHADMRACTGLAHDQDATARLFHLLGPTRLGVYECLR